MSRSKKTSDPAPPVVGTVETRHEALFNQMEARLTEDFTMKIERMQEALLASMAPQQPPQPPPKKGKKRQTKPSKQKVQSSEDEEEESDVEEIVEPAPKKPGRKKKQKSVIPEQPSAEVRQTPTVTSKPAAPATVNTRWDAWIAAQDTMPISAPTLPMSVNDLNMDDEDQLQRILTTTANHLARGTQKTGFYVHKYVTRGREKRRTSLNMLSLPEYNWGLCMMIKDEQLPAAVCPYIIQHLEEINEDAIDYDWASAVRCWSEEVFTLVAENRLDGGWADTSRIQMLRITLSKVITAKKQDKEQFGRPRLASIAHSTEVFKGGPPCPQYNSQLGCPLQSGHSGPNGRRYVHVCSYCLSQTAAVNHHSEVMCRNKARQGYNNHF